MDRGTRIGVAAIVTACVVAALVLRSSQHRAAEPDAGRVLTAATTVPSSGAVAAMPRLLDLGATRCIPCKAMAPILEELKTTYAGRIRVEFVDVWENPAVAEQYGVQGIPTQIFFDANGQELYRHTGFMARDEILAKCRELGFRLD